MSGDQTKWYDRALASNIVGGLVLRFVIWFAPRAISEATKAKVPLEILTELHSTVGH